jgi:hypothetical protein
MIVLADHPELRTLPMDPKEYRSKTGPLPEDAFGGDVEYKPNVRKAYSAESNARMKAALTKSY